LTLKRFHTFIAPTCFDMYESVLMSMIKTHLK
jgi:hypothetical protein